ncbi:MAG: GGDEF domain-containing protein [Gammaproteobacteria bacterium]|nr:GGDEF domain-containing protein [Gammaproteobacteria bacterium]
MKSSNFVFLNRESLPAIAVILSMVFWLIDAVIDVLYFEENETLVESLIFPDAIELWMRLLVVFLLISFSYYSKYLLISHINISNELTEYKNKLEDLVNERTEELKVKNGQLEKEIKIRKDAEERLGVLVITDPLTLLYNRRKFNEILSYEIARDRRYKSGLSLIFFDIDYFKKVNDTYGHEVGDKVLKQFSTIIKESIRDSDLFARWGGEEFVLLISDSDPEKARSIAEKTRHLIENTEFETVGKITASFGVASLMGDDDERTLINRADNALYLAKENGRNLVVVADD